MRARRLEVANVAQYLGKQIDYGGDFPRYAPIAGARTLDAKQRLQVFRRTVRANRLGAVDAAVLLGLLAIGAICYEAARLRGARGQPTPLPL
jgi:hypothetical protein